MMNRRSRIVVPALAASIAAGACGSSDDQGRFARADQAVVEAGSELEGSDACASVEQLARDCPPEILWRNHGQYVSCVAKYVDARREAGDLSQLEADGLVREAARSDIGKPHTERAREADPDEASAGASAAPVTEASPAAEAQLGASLCPPRSGTVH